MSRIESATVGAWVLIGMNLLTAFGSIWIFMRMAPAIDQIIARNAVSLEASEAMLAALATSGHLDAGVERAVDAFAAALDRARRNITEPEEREVLDRIAGGYDAAFAGEAAARIDLVRSVSTLGEINRDAMRRADVRARQLGHAGAWGVVFMATLIFAVGMILLRTIRRHLADPIQEIDAAVAAFRHGDVFRRCHLRSPPRRIRLLFTHLNDVLDRACAPSGPEIADG